MPKMHTSEEQRNFYRVRDDIVLHFVTVDKDTLAHGNPADSFPASGHLQVFTEFKKLGGEFHKLLSDVPPALTNALKIQDKRLELLAKHLFIAQANDSLLSAVSLSEGGIAFLSDKAPYKGSLLALSLTFLSSGYSLFVFADVLRTETKGKKFQIAARFMKLAESDKTLLARHILAAQRKPESQTLHGEKP